MKRIWHPFTAWEDVEMWTPCHASERRGILEKAIAFTGDHVLYGKAMLDVLSAFPKACEHNLTDIGMNRQAWIGHAACFLAIRCPEDVTREAWGLLSDEQRDLANAEADKAIDIWVADHETKNREMDRKMGKQRLLEWHT